MVNGTPSPPGRDVIVETGTAALGGFLQIPEAALGVVVFAHGSGSSRHSPRNAAVAARLNEVGLATLLFDLLTPLEAADRANVFDIELLSDRLGGACRWIGSRPELAALPLGLFGASTGAAAALVAATQVGSVAAVVSRGGRPDLAGPHLADVRTPTLLIVGSRDEVVLQLNREALAAMPDAGHRLEIVPGATHLFEEPGALERVSDLAASWFVDHLGPGLG